MRQQPGTTAAKRKRRTGRIVLIRDHRVLSRPERWRPARKAPVLVVR
jgi:hypothetical protein